ncbi:hypothetical protein D3C85_1664310 [compost metagenome]
MSLGMVHLLDQERMLKVQQPLIGNQSPRMFADEITKILNVFQVKGIPQPHE